MSQHEEYQHYAFSLPSSVTENKRKMTINLPSIFDRSCPLGLLEIIFQDNKILKFSGGTCPQASPLSKIPIWRGL